MTRFLRTAWIVARHELADSVRSRRAAVVLLLYLLGSMAATNGFISVLRRLEVQLVETLQLSPTASTGAVTQALWQSDAFRRMVVSLVGNREVAMTLLAVPPMALLYGWLAFTFTPILVVLSCSSRVAEEAACGSLRFVMLRATRAAWCIGKFGGQALLVFLALVLSAVGAWCVARFRLSGFQAVPAAVAMTVYAGKVWIYSLAFVGLALGISQLTRSPNLATALGFLAWIGLTVVAWVARHYAGQGVRRLWELVALLTPQGHRLDLWHVRGPHLLSGAAFVLALGLVYLLCGYMVFSRKDV